jgi:NAD(P)-dependent dehydrogenase (short-subunit alcohol dehydrogenase family)
LALHSHNAWVNTVIVGIGGIGSALARIAPHPLIVAGRKPATLRALAAETSAYSVPVDVTRDLEVAALASEVAARGGTRVLVYAVGDIAVGALELLSRADLERIWGANVLGVQLVLKHLAPTLEPDARVYVIGARAELTAFKGFAAYAAAKAAVDALARVTTLELGRPITVVKPGAVNTAFWARFGGRAPRNALEPAVVAQAIVDSLARDPVAELPI